MAASPGAVALPVLVDRYLQIAGLAVRSVLGRQDVGR